ncbi:hypothetical protein HYX19_02965 [Candidatus Woesearchaeota archaeon]|nr:hypothetical protein [Candidatus Woesearchaeota archaeon]
MKSGGMNMTVFDVGELLYLAGGEDDSDWDNEEDGPEEDEQEPEEEMDDEDWD